MKGVDKQIFSYIDKTKPSAIAEIQGGEKYPNIQGIVEFYGLKQGVCVVGEIENLPNTNTDIFAMHIHENGDCQDNFSKTGGHYNPTEQPHPKHAGDMPPIFSNNGEAFFMFYTERFLIKEIIGKSVVIHEMPDDFTTQPAGNSGQKIACGIIQKFDKNQNK